MEKRHIHKGIDLRQDNGDIIGLGLCQALCCRIGIKAMFFYGLAPLSAAAFAVAYVLVTATVCKFKYGVMLVPVSLYCFVVVYSFAAAVSAAAAGTAGVLVAVGAALFLVSDIVLSVYIFAPVRCRALGILNLAAYFPAQFLLALSILFV